MKLTLTQFVSLDGVCQGPGSPDEDTSDGFTRGGWLVPYIDDTFVAQASDWLDHADALLVGRRTYDAFARDWPAITDPADPFAERMNSLPKFVASASLEPRVVEAGAWQPTTLLRGDEEHVTAAVGRLKERPGRELQIQGSARLGHALFVAGLVDVVRLVVAPTAVGAGRTLFTGHRVPAGFTIERHRVTPAGLLLVECTVAGPATVGRYTGATARTES